MKPPGARYEGLEALPHGDHRIEIVTPAGEFDLHNDAYLEAIVLEPSHVLSVTLRGSPLGDDRVYRVRLRFLGVRDLASLQFEDDPRNASVWEHLVDWGGRFELRTGTHEFEFEAAVVSAEVEPLPPMAIDPGAFEAAVEQDLAPVLRRVGFEESDREPYATRFVRPPVVLEVAYDATRSWELAVWLGRTDREETPIDLDHALEATDCGEDVIAGLRAMQTGDPRVLRKLLARAAAALGGCGAELLAEDGAALDRAFERREAEAAEYERSYISPRLLAEADAAWVAKDLPLLKDLLDPVRDVLEPRHARRLAFAEKRLLIERP